MHLDLFRKAKAKELAALHDKGHMGTIAPYTGPRPDFCAALHERAGGDLPAVIAEYKRASPSRGPICQDISCAACVRSYAAHGAAAISVLTETEYFDGKLDFLAEARSACAHIPLLRKDFLFDPLQIDATAATPASALLLIVRLTPDPQVLRTLRERAEHLGMTAVVEIFDAKDLAIARESGATCIQVNARDLATLAVDRSSVLEIVRRFPPRPGETWIAASGITSHADLLASRDAGYTACLVGTHLMASGDPGGALQALLTPALQEANQEASQGAKYAR